MEKKILLTKLAIVIWYLYILKRQTNDLFENNLKKWTHD